MASVALATDLFCPEAPPPPAHRRPFVKVGVSGIIALIIIARLIWIATSAHTGHDFTILVDTTS